MNEYEMQKHVWVFWSGGPMPPLISKCREIMKLFSKKNKNYILHEMNEENIHEYIEVTPRFKELKMAHKADYVRVKLLRMYGGIWLDSDVILITPLKQLFKTLEIGNGFFINEENKNLCNGVFGSKANTSLMIHWEFLMENIIEKKGGKIEWSEIGAYIINHFRKKYPEYMIEYTIINGYERNYRIDWHHWKDFYSINDRLFTNIIQNDDFVMLLGNVYRNYETINNDPKNKYKKDRFLINRLINYSYRESS